MTAQELLTGEVSKHWTADLPKVITKMNTRSAARSPVKLSNQFLCKGDACKLLPIGAKVRVMLEQPKGLLGDNLYKLHGKFRSTDIRWSPEVRTIKNVTLKPNMPPLYLLNGNVSNQKIEPIGYTKNQLQLIPDNEEYPKGEEVIRGDPKTYVVQKITDKKKERGRFQYLVQWRGFKDQTWEPATTIKAQVPDIVKEYEDIAAAKKLLGSGNRLPFLLYF